MKMPIQNNVICRAALVLAFGSFVLGASAVSTVVTQTVDGVSWTVNINSSTGKAMIGPVSSTQSGWANAQYRAFSTPTHNNPSYPSIVSIPLSFTAGETEYEVNKIGNRAFYGLANITDVVIPGTVVQIYDYAFHACGGLKNVCLKGPATVEKGHPQTYVELARAANAFGSATQTRNIQLFLMGPNIKNNSGETLIAAGATNMTVLLPNRSDNTTWSSFDTSDKVGSGENNTVKFYGPGEVFDLKMYETSVTIVPTTAAALTDALAWAPTFKSGFGLDMHISITNAIDTAIDVAEHPGVTFDTQAWQKFAVSNQAQLDGTLAAVSADSSIIIDATDATEDIVIPEGRRISVIVPPGGTFWKQWRGFVLMVQ